MSDAPDGPGPEPGPEPEPEPPLPQDPAADAQVRGDHELIPHSPDEPAWMRLIGPVRSENAAFRVVLWAAGAALAIAAVALVVRAVS